MRSTLPSAERVPVVRERGQEGTGDGATGAQAPVREVLGLDGPSRDGPVTVVGEHVVALTGSAAQKRYPVQVERRAERALVQRTLLPDQESLSAEHRELVIRRHAEGEISKKELARLTFLKWQLDRIDDAMMGPHLDQLEKLAGMHERLAETALQIGNEVRAATGGIRRRPGR